MANNGFYEGVNLSAVTVYKGLDNNTDIHTDTQKQQYGIFENSVGTKNGTALGLATSLESSNFPYFRTIAEGAAGTGSEMFDVAYGHYAGSGSDVSTGNINDSKLATKAVYNQFANVVLDDPNQKFAFTDVSTGGDISSGATEDDVYIFSVKSAKMKDRVATKFTLTLSGSQVNSYGSASLVMTTYTASKFSSMAGDYYKVVSGSAGNPHVTAGGTTLGHFYPSIGTIIFSAANLSASMPGTSSVSGTAEGHVDYGLSPDLGTETTKTASNNALKLYNCLSSGSISMKNEVDLNQTKYVCRLGPTEFNATSNPTFVKSGSLVGEILDPMQANPTVYCTGIGLYNSSKEMIAIAKLNLPQKKRHGESVEITAVIDG
jgi:hypothetical protein